MPLRLTPLNAIYALWVLWWVTWHLAALWTSNTTAADTVGRRYIFVAGIVLGFAMLFWPSVPGPMGAPVWILSDGAAWTCVGVAAVGVAFMWWARIHLGRLWSGSIVTRENHRVVDTGPYRLVRHPIYTGFFATALALALVKGTPLALAGVVILILAFTAKAQAEETFLMRQMGAAYAEYRKRVPMLIPFWPV